MTLRPYQSDAIARVQDAYRAGARSVLLQLPTGAGKTHLAAGGVIAPSVARGRRVAFVAHLEEIVLDTAARLRALGLHVGVVKAGIAPDPAAPVQVCATLTLVSRAVPADRVILDEAHRAASDTNRAILARYRGTGTLALGLTATPARGDGQPLDEFDALVCGPSVRDLIAAGALVPCDVHAPARYLADAVARDPVELVLSEARDRRVAVFAPDAATATDVADRLTAGGYPVALVLDSTPSAERRSVRARLEAGEIRGVVSCRAIVEGFDAPLLDCAVLAGPFGTLVPYLQAIGRVVRAAPGKARAVVYDLRGACYLHGLPDEDREWSLAGRQGAVRASEGLRRCDACHAVFPPAARCPRCGSVRVADQRPLRVQRAEMWEASGMPAAKRAELYVEAVARKLMARGMSAARAYAMARARAPGWVKEAKR